MLDITKVKGVKKLIRLNKGIKYLLRLKLSRWLLYLIKNKRLLHLRNPKTYTEKIIHRMYYPLPSFSFLADKLAVRNYVRAKIGDSFLIPVYNIYDEFKYEDFQILPDSFVLKANHGCGFNLIVRNKKNIIIEDIINKVNKWLKIDYSKEYGENQYSNIKRKLFSEMLILDNDNLPTEYKVNCFNNFKGNEFIVVRIISDRFSEIKKALILSDWTAAPFQFKGDHIDYTTEILQHKPDCWEELIIAAKILSNGLGFCRADFYVVGNRIYFSEITLTPLGGYHIVDPARWDLTLGEKFGWPEKDLDFKY